MTEGDKRAERWLRDTNDQLAALTGRCPVCHRNKARMTAELDDGSQEGVCENHERPCSLSATAKGSRGARRQFGRMAFRRCLDTPLET
jgi:hypothetical protein